MTDDLLLKYTRLYQEVLRPVASSLQRLLEGYMDRVDHVERVIARAKDPDRFIEKARRTAPGGRPKYAEPLSQVQDQIGARIIVYYKGDVAPVSEVVLRYLRAIEERELVPESEWAFGYFGRHFILALPPDAVPEPIKLDAAPRFFELQVKTLFQHAWSEANHDLGYKPIDSLSDDQKRRVAFTAAQAWGADHVFEELVAELS
jgi:putative GTP pyrophosphokinase